MSQDNTTQDNKRGDILATQDIKEKIFPQNTRQHKTLQDSTGQPQGNQPRTAQNKTTQEKPFPQCG
jgi:hypothetical protein